jgi:uncharacterized protein YneF (UPF0154 family)
VKALLTILLVVSLAFNVFSLVGRFQARTEPEQPPTFEERARIMAVELGLDAEQEQVFEELLSMLSEMRQARGPQRDLFYEELVKENPDGEVLKSYWMRSSTDEQRLAILARLEKFVGTLSAEQREMFVETMKNRHSHRRTRSEK